MLRSYGLLRTAIAVAAVVLIAVPLAGCATTGPVEPLPANYRQMIAEYARTSYFFDPYSIRDASISSRPGSDTSFSGPYPTVCVRANAKNRMGGYIGIKASRFDFRNGKVVRVTQDDSGILCGGETYEPFPELEDGGRSPKTG